MDIGGRSLPAARSSRATRRQPSPDRGDARCDDEGDVIGKRTAEGALTGAVGGALFGPAGLAVGLTAGATVGGVSQAEHAPALHDAFIDEVRADVPEKSSAVLLLASPEHVDAMVAAFEGRGGQLIRHSLSPEAAQALQAAVARSPTAAPASTTEGEIA